MKQSIFILVLLSLLACKDSGSIDLNYPLFEISNVDVKSTEVITVDVSFTYLGSDEILRYGFVWDWIRIPTLGTFSTPSTGRDFIFIEGAPDFNGFSENIDADFQRGQRHSIRAFVISPTDTIYSSTKDFVPNP